MHDGVTQWKYVPAVTSFGFRRSSTPLIQILYLARWNCKSPLQGKWPPSQLRLKRRSNHCRHLTLPPRFMPHHPATCIDVVADAKSQFGIPSSCCFLGTGTIEYIIMKTVCIINVANVDCSKNWIGRSRRCFWSSPSRRPISSRECRRRLTAPFSSMDHRATDIRRFPAAIPRVSGRERSLGTIL